MVVVLFAAAQQVFRVSYAIYQVAIVLHSCFNEFSLLYLPFEAGTGIGTGLGVGTGCGVGNPCLNAGVCAPTVTGYQCLCAGSYVGSNCQTNTGMTN